jgi:hypothetical protein
MVKLGVELQEMQEAPVEVVEARLVAVLPEVPEPPAFYQEWVGERYRGWFWGSGGHRSYRRTAARVHYYFHNQGRMAWRHFRLSAKSDTRRFL